MTNTSSRRSLPIYGWSMSHCFSCGEKVSYESCCILPAISKLEKARITCNSPLCITTYIEDFEKEEIRR